jgi:hypothetical protein
MGKELGTVRPAQHVKPIEKPEHGIFLTYHHGQ